MPARTRTLQRSPRSASAASFTPGARLNFSQLEQLWISQGGDRQLAPVMAAIALAESGGNPHALNDNASTGDYSVGLWQINYFGSLYGGRSRRYGPPEALLSPAANARAAIDLAQGGRGLSNWSTYTSGAYQSHLSGAAASPTAAWRGRTRPDTSAGGGGGGIGGFISGAGDAIGSAAEDAWKGSLGVISGPADFLRMGLWLVEPKTWLRAVEFIAGAGLMFLSLIGLAVAFFARSETGQAISSSASSLPGPLGNAGRVVSAVGKPSRAARRETRGYVKRRTTPTPEERRATIRARTRQVELDRQARDEERRKVRGEASDQRMRRRRAALGRTGTDDEIPF